MISGIEPTITLTKDDNWWIVEDTEIGVITQGTIREASLATSMKLSVGTPDRDTSPPSRNSVWPALTRTTTSPGSHQRSQTFSIFRSTGLVGPTGSSI